MDKNNTYTSHKICQVWALALCGLITVHCSVATNMKPTHIFLATSFPTPEYLLFVKPYIITQEKYNSSTSSSLYLARGVAISFWANKIDISEENCTWESVKHKINLYIDGERLSDDSLRGGADGERGCGLFRASWVPDLTVGLHAAKFTIIDDSNDVLEYSWQIVIEK